jgi:WD40 repeat protein
VALHAGPADPQGSAAADRPVGCGVLVDRWRVLTCLSVVRDRHSEATPLWAAFPKAGVARTVRRRVLAVRGDEAYDVAVLVLDQPAPAAVGVAPLLCPDGTDLVGERWWAFGFPADAPFGSDAHGWIGAALAYGWVRLETESRMGLTEGFVGAGVWSPRFEAVVGLLGRVQTIGGRAGDAAALTLRQVSEALPDEVLHLLAGWTVLDAGESALAAWGWSLTGDVEAGRHWEPRARGVAVESERGYRFRGRRAALSTVVAWLDRDVLDDRVLVVTGSPGVGKSAVLGRVVTTADARIRAMLPAEDDNVTATVGSVACAVHVKGKTALDVAVEIARAAAIRMPEQPADVAPALRKRAADRHTPRFNLVIDALDEAVSPEQAQQIVEDIILPVVRTCGPVGAQVVVGTRRSDDGGDLLHLFGPDCVVVDLDSEEFFEVDDLAAYALATLRLVGDERAGSPYASMRAAGPVAARIAELADRNFLVAGLTARRHGLYDTVAARPDELAFSADVDAALEAYVRRLPRVGPAPAKLALTALAYAQAPGLSIELWQAAIRALGPAVSAADLAHFAHSSAANFLVESSGELAGRRFRLFHQALNDALLRERQQGGVSVDDQRAISERLIRQGRRDGWARTDRYLLRSLAEHAAAGGVIDDLLVDDEYLLHADLLRLTPPADYARSILGQQRARLLRLTPQAAAAGPAERTAQFSVTAALEGLDARVVVDHDAPYRAAWAQVRSRLEWAVLEGHASAVEAVCALRTRSRRLVLASGGSDGTVRVWNPNTGQQDRIMLAGSPVVALRPVPVDGRTLIASAGADGMVVLWDPETGQPRHTLPCPAGQIRALTAFALYGTSCLGIVCADGSLTTWSPPDGAARRHAVHTDKITTAEPCGPGMVVAGGQDGTIQLWPIGESRPRWSVDAHDGGVTAICPIHLAGSRLLASAGTDATLRIWDAGGAPRHRLDAGGTVRALCPVTIRGAVLLAAGGDDGVIRLWDPVTGRQVRALPDQGSPIRSLCTVEVQGRLLLASVGDAAVRLWEPDVSHQAGTAMRSAEVTSLAAVWQDRKDMVACGKANGSVHLHNSATGEEVRVLTGHRGPITSLSAVVAFGEVMLAASSTDDTVGVWKLGTGSQRPFRYPRGGWAGAVCGVYRHPQLLLACAGERGTVRLWDPFTGRRHRRAGRWLMRREPGHAGAVSGMCVMPFGRGVRVVTAGHDCTVRVWNLKTGRQEIVFDRHKGRVRAVCALIEQGAEVIASAGDDQLIRLWDARTGEERQVLHGHTSRITAVCPVRAGDRTLLASTSHDGTARVWNPSTGSLELTVPVHHEALACVFTGDRLIIGSTAGTLAINLNL